MTNVLDMLVLILIPSCLWTWGRIIVRLRAGLPVLSYEPRVAARWTVIDVALVVAFYCAVSVALLQFSGATSEDSPVANPVAPVGQPADPGAGDAPRSPEASVHLLLLSALANLLTVAFAMLLLRFRCGASWADMGLSVGSLARDAQVGWFAFAAISPPVYALQGLLSRYFPKQHPLVEMLQEGRSIALVVASVASAVVIAPLVEEFFFRAILQGWLTRVLDREPEPAERPAMTPSEVEGAPPPDPVARVVDVDNPYSSPSAYEADIGRAAAIEAVSPAAPRTAWAPIVASSTVFAVLHLGHGPAPIPLFFLALVLGWLFQRTGRIAPSVIVHFCLNGMSMLALFSMLDR